jgi:hypothetical protein
MSTDVENAIRWWIEQGELFGLEPIAARDRKLRSMYLTRPLFEAMNNPAAEHVERFARLEADLEVFVTSPRIDPGYLKGLWPPRDGVWAIRSVRPRPSIRVLGFFPMKDRFIATNYALRNDLGAFDSRQWKTEMKRATHVWRRLFPAYPFVSSRDAHDLFTGALNGTYFKE